MAAIRQRRIQGPHSAGHTHRILGHGLREVAARRRHRADERQRTDARIQIFAAHALDASGALVEFRDTRGQVRRIPFFTGHLFKARRNLAQGLGPTGGTIRHHSHVVALVTVILRQRDTRVHRRVARGNGHVRSIYHEHGPVHERVAGLRVFEVREFVEHVGHLIAALTATHVDDDVRVAVLREALLHHRLSGAKGAGHDGRTALCNRKQTVEHTLTGKEQLVRAQFLAVRARLFHRPLLQHGDLCAVLKLRNDIGHGVFAFGHDARDRALRARRGKHTMREILGLGDRTQRVATRYAIAHLHDRGEFPPLVTIQRGRGDSAADEIARFLAQRFEGALNAVEGPAEEPGPELDD